MWTNAKATGIDAAQRALLSVQSFAALLIDPYSEDGQDMIEYSLLAALISIVAIAIILLIGPYLDNLFQDVINGLNGA